MARSNAHTQIGSAFDWAVLSGSDIDCVALWGNPCCSIVIGGAGNVAVEKTDGTNVTLNLTGYPAGYRLDVQVNKVLNTGTTATGVIVLCNLNTKKY